MEYKFAPNMNYEDLSSGRVIFHEKGFSNFPARLASEIFMRCYELIGNSDEKVKIYDPCCGGGYLLTTLGFLHHEKIAEVYASDVSPDAIQLASKNLGLLTTEGLIQRKAQLMQLYEAYGKESHQEAILSVEKLAEKVEKDIESHVFIRDVLDEDYSGFQLPLFDIIITDVPYGDLVTWSSDDRDNMNLMLKQLAENLKDTGVITVISNKKQKILTPCLNRVAKVQIGKRKVEIFKKV